MAEAEKPPRVLVVDDDPALLRMLKLAFQLEGFEVATAGDGVEALSVLDADGIDVMVLDLQMPRMDGRECYRELRARGHAVPVTILSAYGADDAKRELGAEKAVGKPFDPIALVEEVRELLGSGATPG